jgi:hypothetical protein
VIAANNRNVRRHYTPFTASNRVIIHHQGHPTRTAGCNLIAYRDLGNGHKVTREIPCLPNAPPAVRTDVPAMNRSCTLVNKHCGGQRIFINFAFCLRGMRIFKYPCCALQREEVTLKVYLSEADSTLSDNKRLPR